MNYHTSVRITSAYDVRKPKHQMDEGISFWKNCGAASVGRRKECLVLSVELLTKGKLAIVKRFKRWRFKHLNLFTVHKLPLVINSVEKPKHSNHQRTDITLLADSLFS